MLEGKDKDKVMTLAALWMAKPGNKNTTPLDFSFNIWSYFPVNGPDIADVQAVLKTEEKAIQKLAANIDQTIVKFHDRRIAKEMKHAQSAT